MRARVCGVAVLAALAVPGAVGALAGCADDSSKSGATNAGTTAAVVSTTTVTATTTAATTGSTAKPPTAINVKVEPGTGSGFEGAKADVSGLTCVQTDGGWKAAGTVTNSTAGPVDYRIYVSLLDGTNDTRGLFEVDVDGVKAGQGTPWSGELTLAEADLTCVLRVERTAA